jgi:hypothetical protein
VLEKKMKRLLLTTLCLGSFTVNAALFQGTSSGNYVNPTGPSGMVTTGVGTSEFTWGAGQPGSLGYKGKAFDVNENGEFVFGSLDYFNGTTNSGTDTNKVDLDVGLNFTSPTSLTENFTFNLGIENTPNTSSDPNENADIVNFDNTVPSNFFSSDGVDYTLEFLGFGTLTGEGFTVEDSFRVLENEGAKVDLVGRITSTPSAGPTPSTDPTTPSAVPVPAAVWLFGSGMIGLIGMRRKA